jgi:hypothetical protein
MNDHTLERKFHKLIYISIYVQFWTDGKSMKKRDNKEMMRTRKRR